MRDEFKKAISDYQSKFGLSLAAETIGRLADYYEKLIEHNSLLHLVAPCSADAFATRHVLESLTLLKYLPMNASFADVGSGGGLPAIPCLIARDDLKGRLIESKEKKADFLNGALESLGLMERSEVVAKQFSETDAGEAEFVTCRALDKFSANLRRLIKWSGSRSLLFFGGEEMGRRLRECGVETAAELMPLSDRRYLFIASRERRKSL